MSISDKEQIAVAMAMGFIAGLIIAPLFTLYLSAG
jgi:hypothetical protein